ncbi:MAG: aminotransferase class I/II-fold pyridoxal phosphate-dependent enzyme [Eubacterium sp.]|nr:aminotransferase class I/II-fold pyridoxal phosphate-dependent enzyme [Eubacterium sp.]
MGNRRIELGSEYHMDLSGLKKTDRNLFQYLKPFSCAVYYDSGRSALREFAKLLREGQKVLLPEYICESVIRCFPFESIDFYRVFPDFTIDVDEIKQKMKIGDGVLLLMNYYGKLLPEALLKEVSGLAKEYNWLILEDTTHSLFSAARTIGDYMVCSLRKWMPLSKGGVLYSKDAALGMPGSMPEKSTDNERFVGFILKDRFLKGQGDYNVEYRRIFAACEERLDRRDGVYLMSDFNSFVAECVDVEDLVAARKRNARLLETLLPQELVSIRFSEDECPFGFPVRVPKRDRFREYLMENRIYCAVHWPFDGFMEDRRPGAVANAKELITLPVDQRYAEEDMQYMADVIKKYGGKLTF